MRRHISNAAYGVLDYISYPFGMLLVAPIVLHRLGGAEYGMWMVATAVISAGGIVASGFCDAGIQRIARHRGAGAKDSIAFAIRGMLGINLVLGSAVAILAWAGAPYGAQHIAASHLVSERACVIALRIASVVILMRAAEAVAVSTQRAFERYSAAVQISTAIRLLTLGSAAILALAGCRTVSILIATAVLFAVGTYLQFRQVRLLLGPVLLWPSFDREEARILTKFGRFTWLQAAGSVVFGQLDRIILGIYLGAIAVTPYSLCIQLAHPIYGVATSGLSFLFPYLSGRVGIISSAALNRTVLKAFVCNLLLVCCCAGLVLMVGDRLIRLWAGKEVAESAATILPPIVVGSALMGLSVTATYAMQALDLFRTAACISLAARAAMLLPMVYLLDHRGLEGLAMVRVAYGVALLSLYVPLLRRLNAERREEGSVRATAAHYQVQEGSKS